MSFNIFISIITIIILIVIIIIVIVIIYPIKKYEQFDVSASTDDLLKRIEALEHPKQLCIDTLCINKEQWGFLGTTSLTAITAIAANKK